MKKEWINQWVEEHREEIIQDIMELVNIKSEAEAGDEEHPFGKGVYQAMKYMEDKAAQLQLTVKNYDNYCASITLGEQEDSIGLFSHLDVVPAGNNWLLEPYQTTRTREFLIGRGVSDNKGPAVGAFYLLKFFKEHKYPLRHRLVQYLGCNEESGMKDIEYYLSKEKAPDLSLVPDMAFPICYAEKGILVFQLVYDLTDPDIIDLYAGTADNVIPDYCRLKLRGKDENRSFITEGFAGHAAAPTGEPNAVSKMADLVKEQGLSTDPVFEEIGKLATEFDGTSFSIRQENKELGDLTCALTVIRCEDQKAALTFNIRYPAVMDGDKIRQNLESYAHDHGCRLVIREDNRGFSRPKESQVVNTLKEVYRDWTGISADPFTSAGGTYARKLPNAFGAGLQLNGVANPISGIFTSGHGGAHQPDEALCLDQLMTGIKILIDAVARIDEVLP